MGQDRRSLCQEHNSLHIWHGEFGISGEQAAVNGILIFGNEVDPVRGQDGGNDRKLPTIQHAGLLV